MTELDRMWAESQIEGMADDTLSVEAEKRMREAMQEDPELARRVERARALKQALGQLKRTPVPRGLMWRLWQIPAANAEPKTRGTLWMPAGVLATAVVAAIGATVFFGTPEPSLDDAARAAAVEDFAITMAYLQKGAMMAQNEINETFGSGVVSALSASRGMMERTEIGTSEGERENVD